MKKRILFTLSVIILLALTLVSTIPAAAKASFQTVCGLETDYKDIPGQVWFSDNGNILHIRSQISLAHIEGFPDHPECNPTYSNGELSMSVNVDLNLVTGEGKTWGFSTLTPTGVNGTFVGPFVGKIHGFMMTGQSFAVGTGKLKGLLEEVSIQQIGQTTYDVHGHVFAH